MSRGGYYGAIGLICALIVVLIVRKQAQLSGPRRGTVGVVDRCLGESYLDDDDKRVYYYRTVYTFKDEAGRDWKASTERIPACLEAGKKVDVTWPDGHPEHSDATESFAR